MTDNLLSAPEDEEARRDREFDEILLPLWLAGRKYRCDFYWNRLTPAQAEVLAAAMLRAFGPPPYLVPVFIESMETA